MFKKDNIWLGMLIGLIFPAIAFFFVEILKKNIELLKKDDLLYIGCVAINLLMVRYFFKQDKENTVRGIIGATFICAFIFFFYKVRS
ncbi:MAG: hypothetical protein JWN56_703 [Sphingobacteriales bacterium]|nr:hypothetical protein [Sphingobacteriales bacterium]